jgi:hypothetical protein
MGSKRDPLLSLWVLIRGICLISKRPQKLGARGIQRGSRSLARAEDRSLNKPTMLAVSPMTLNSAKSSRNIRAFWSPNTRTNPAAGQLPHTSTQSSRSHKGQPMPETVTSCHPTCLARVAPIASYPDSYLEVEGAFGVLQTYSLIKWRDEQG